MIPDPEMWEARFKNELEIQKIVQEEYMRCKFNERELKELVYMMGELRTAREVLKNEKDK